jgi:hypothetical protein
MRAFTMALCAGLLLLAAAMPAAAQKRKLDDKEMDQVSAGGISTQLQSGILNFQFQSPAGQNHAVEGSGTIQVLENKSEAATGALLLSDNAQQNLQSLVNITAVNSRIQVLLNLNVNIHSIVGTLRQTNLSAIGPE